MVKKKVLMIFYVHNIFSNKRIPLYSSIHDKPVFYIKKKKTEK